MGQISLGMNLEATRHHDKPFEWGLDRAAEMGYEYVEPMVHFGRELMSEAGYYHTVSMFNDPLVMRKMCEDRGPENLRPSSPRAGLPARLPRRVPEDGDSLRGRVRRAGGQHRRRHQGALDHRGGRPRADAVHALRSGFGGRAAGSQDRAGMPRPVLQDPRGPRPHLQPGSLAGHRHQPRYGQRLPCRPGPLRMAGARRRTVWSTCTPRTSATSIPRPNAAKSAARPSAAPAATA